MPRPGGAGREDTAAGKVAVSWGLPMGSIADYREVVEMEDTLSQ